MLHRDYLVDQLINFADGIRRAFKRARDKKDPDGSAQEIDRLVGDILPMDGKLMLSMDPASLLSLLKVSSPDRGSMEYVARSLKLAGELYGEAGDESYARLRLAQARALDEAYGFGIGEMDSDELLAGLHGSEEAGGASDSEA